MKTERRPDANLDLMKPKFSEACRIQNVGEELLVLNHELGEVHQLNATAALIFQLCNGTHSAGDIAEAVATSFAIELAQAHQDVQSTLAQLGDLGLIKLAEAS